VKIRCWNCGTEEANLEASACGFCGEILRPDEAQRSRAVERVEFLIRELKRWKSVPDWWKREAEDNYRKRLTTLRDLPQEGQLVEAQPERKPAAPPPLASRPNRVEKAEAIQRVLDQQPQPRASREDKAEAIQRLLDLQPHLQEEAPAPVAFEPHVPSEADLAMQMLMGAFSEKKIRLLYALGGVLLLASAVGILGSNWEGWGRQAMGLLLTALPVLFFWLAGQLKEKLPVSSRMFTVLGGGMLPIGLIFLNIFNAPGALWNPLAFLIGWWVNRKNSDEPICTYLSGLCWALAGWTTGSGLTLGLFSFAGAGLLFWKERDNVHWTRVGHGLAFLGLLSAFTAGRLQAGPAMTLFLLAIVYFTTTALVLNTTRSMIGSTLICLLCAGWMGAQLEWPSATVGLAALLQGMLYIRRGQAGQALAIYLTGGVLLLFLGLPLLFNHHANSTQLITGILGALFYGAASYHYRRPNWAYGASLCSLYAYLCLLSLMQSPAYRPSIILMMLVWQVAVTLLRNFVPKEYLRPWAFTAAATAIVLIPVNAVLHATGADYFTPWIYLGVSAVIALCAINERESKALYVSTLTAALAYATWLPLLHSTEPNLGLGFTAFVAALALLGLALRKTDYATPLLVSAAIAGWIFSTMQFYYLAIGYWSSATAALVFYGIAFALPRQKVTNLQAGLCLITAVACIDHFGNLGLSLALVACALATLKPGYMEAALLWSGALAVLGPISFKMVPSLLWLASAARQGDRKLAPASALLTLPCILLGGLEGHNTALLALLCAGYLGLAVRWNEASLMALAWLGLKPVYAVALPETTWTLALWAEWALFYIVNRKLTTPVVAVEALTGLTLLLTSFWLGGWAAALNPWLVVVLLMVRSHQTGRADLATIARVVVVWAAFSNAEVAHYWLVFALELFLWCYLEAIVFKNTKSLQILGSLAWLGCLYSHELMLLCLTLGLGAGAFALARIPLASVALIYHAYVAVLLTNEITTVELYTVPLAAGMLLAARQPQLRQAGLFALLLPSLVLSLGSAEHALWAGSLSLVVLALGQITHRANYMAWGGLALLTEVAIQAVLFATNLPWHQWAVAGGLLLVGMAFLVERRRQEVTQASRSFLQHLNAW
jgi:hypothetical protein